MSEAQRESIFDYKSLAADVRRKQDERKMTLKDIATESGVDSSKLTNLVRLRGGLSVDNLFVVCDWVGRPVDHYRVAEPPKWLVERLAAGNDLTDEQAQQLANDRADSARRQAAASAEIDAMSIQELEQIVRDVRSAETARR